MNKFCSYSEHVGRRAVMFCKDCKQYYCSECETGMHSKIFPKHASNVVRDINKEIFIDECPKHPKYPLDFFCNSHYCLCCAMCMAKGCEHSSCNVVPFSSVDLKIAYGYLPKLISIIGDELEHLRSFPVQELEDKDTALQLSIKLAQEKVKASFDKLREALNVSEKKLMGELESMKDSTSMSEVISNLKYLETEVEALEQCKKIERTKSTLNPKEIIHTISKGVAASRRLESLAQAAVDKLCESVVPNLVFGEELVSTINSFGKVELDKKFLAPIPKVEVKGNRVFVSWNKVPFSDPEYQVKLTDHHISKSESIYTGTETQYPIDNTICNLGCELQVRAGTHKNYGSWSNSAQICLSTQAESNYNSFLQYYGILPQGKKSFRDCSPSELSLYNAFFNFSNLENFILGSLYYGAPQGSLLVRATEEIMRNHLGPILRQRVAYFSVLFQGIEYNSGFKFEDVLRECCPNQFCTSFCCLYGKHKQVHSVMVEATMIDSVVSALKSRFPTCVPKPLGSSPLFFVCNLSNAQNALDFVRDLRSAVPPFWEAIYTSAPNKIFVLIVYIQDDFEALKRNKIFPNVSRLLNSIPNPSAFQYVGQRIPISGNIPFPEKSTEPCPNDNACPLADPSHLDKYDHPHTNDICLDIYCKNTACRNSRTHFCMNGEACQGIRDPNHKRNNIHLKATCPQGPACRNIDARHRMAYHGEIRDFCYNPNCSDLNPKHTSELIHTPQMLPGCMSGSYLYKKNLDMDANIAEWLKKVQTYVGKDLDRTNPDFWKIVGWLRNMRPVHQCSAKALNSMVSLYTLMSTSVLGDILVHPERIYEMFFMNPTNTGRYGNVGVAERNYLILSMKKHLAEHAPTVIGEINTDIVNGVPIESVSFALGVLGMVDPFFTQEAELTAAERAITNTSVDVMAIGNDLKAFIGTIITSIKEMKAINYDVDVKIGTNMNVFAVLGPNMGNYGDAEISIVFKPSILFHPDTFLTPVAAMGYYQGFYVSNTKVGLDREWMGTAKPWDKGGEQAYREAIFSSSSQGWAEVCAYEWIARVAKKTGKPPKDVAISDVMGLWHDTDPHGAIEAHLPSMLSFDYVEKIYIKKSAEYEITTHTCDFLTEASKRGAILVESVPDTREAVFGLFADVPRSYPPWILPVQPSFDVPEATYPCVLPQRIAKKAKISFDLIGMGRGLNASLMLYGAGGHQERLMRITIFCNPKTGRGCVECYDNADRLVAGKAFNTYLPPFPAEPFTLLICDKRGAFFHSDFAANVNMNTLLFNVPDGVTYVGLNSMPGTRHTAWNFTVNNNDSEANVNTFTRFESILALVDVQQQHI